MRQFGIPGARDESESTARHTGRYFAAAIVGVVMGAIAFAALFGIGRTGAPPANPKLCAICAELRTAPTEPRRQALRDKRAQTIRDAITHQKWAKSFDPSDKRANNGPLEFDCPECDGAYARLLKEDR